MEQKIVSMVIENGTDEAPATLYVLTDAGRIWYCVEPEGLEAGAEVSSEWKSLRLPPLNFGMARTSL